MDKYLLEKTIKYCTTICSDENLYGELILDYECYWQCLEEKTKP